MITACIAFGGFIVVMLASRYNWWYTNIMMLVFFAGSGGAVVNNYFRLSRISKSKDVDTQEMDKPILILQMYVSLFLAGILGFVIYGLFMSRILQGALFPEFSEYTKEDFTSLYWFLVSVLPKTNADAAKVVVWAFISGFSERFVPNLLDSIIAKTEKDN